MLVQSLALLASLTLLLLLAVSQSPSMGVTVVGAGCSRNCRPVDYPPVVGFVDLWGNLVPGT